MNITPGRVVLYTLHEGDAKQIRERRSFHHGNHRMTGEQVGIATGNRVEAGDEFPAIVVKVWGPSCGNLKVLLDGTDDHWATSATEGTGAGQYRWPPKVAIADPAATVGSPEAPIMGARPPRAEGTRGRTARGMADDAAAGQTARPTAADTAATPDIDLPEGASSVARAVHQLGIGMDSAPDGSTPESRGELDPDGNPPTGETPQSNG